MQMVMRGVFQLELLKQCFFSKMLEVIFIKYFPSLSVMVLLATVLNSMLGNGLYVAVILFYFILYLTSLIVTQLS